MCDYSLEHVASRDAKVGDKLISTRFVDTITRGFAGVGNPKVAVCLRPGTEISFAHPVAYGDILGGAPKIVLHTVARFCQIDTETLHVHHDALEFPDGQKVLLTRLVEGQHVTVLQLPAQPLDVKAQLREHDLVT